MINFENGILEKKAYVVIDGIEHEVHMPKYSGKTPISAEILNKMQEEILKTTFPIGSIYITQNNTNPKDILKFGTWERLKGRVCIGVDESDNDFKTIGSTGGEKVHTLTDAELPRRTFLEAKAPNLDGLTKNPSTAVGEVNTGGLAHNNMPPYEIVGYMWIRRT